jgi:ATP phosphoribosyltransferase regulatory subunit
MMGVRADITPQVARIDARNLHRNGPVRLCYADSVLHTLPRGLLSSRAPIRIGAELFGHPGVACDVELIVLMAETLRLAGISHVHIVLGHVGIFRNLLAAAALDKDAESELFGLVQRKAYSKVDSLLEQQLTDQALSGMLRSLSRLSGDTSVLASAKDIFANAPASVRTALSELSQIAERVKLRLPEVTLGFDLSELRGYQYHTGIVFAAYNPAHGSEIAKGGRYDDIGEVFGRARPASGFDADLKTLARLSNREYPRRCAILAPDLDDPGLLALVSTLRADGHVVVSNLGDGMPDATLINELNATRTIVSDSSGGWQVVELKPA